MAPFTLWLAGSCAMAEAPLLAARSVVLDRTLSCEHRAPACSCCLVAVQGFECFEFCFLRIERSRSLARAARRERVGRWRQALALGWPPGAPMDRRYPFFLY